MTVHHAIGHAILDGGKIDMTTVSEGRIGAMVNWLLTRRNCLTMAGTADFKVEQMFNDLKGSAEVIKVEVSGPRP